MLILLRELKWTQRKLGEHFYFTYLLKHEKKSMMPDENCWIHEIQVIRYLRKKYEVPMSSP